MSLFRRRKVADSAVQDGAADGRTASGDGASATTAESGAEPATAAHGVVDDPQAREAADAVGTGGSAARPAAEPAAAAAAAADEAADEVVFDRSGGPFDASEVEDEDGRLSLGGLRLAGREGMELRFEVEEASQRVIAVTVVLGGSTVQLQTFAAPRSFGVWDEIRPEIAQAVAAQGGAAEERTGPLGRELLCRLPVRTEDGRTGHQPTRFAGVDGPRWFLRAVFSGPAAVDASAAAELEAVVRDVVVVRGAEAMAPRELIPLALPQQPGAAPAAPPGGPADGQEQAGGGGAQREELKPFERGPEITEVR
ncbi:DUF3710 domain-containing protein [Kineococcus sp. SYSU DK006]|uniref:DUF3710 domain-containing protein n=1 Tax=Kineococcus sp. SYSU DK006 TaxID=3383127 RepID=UPI003D7F0822